MAKWGDYIFESVKICYLFLLLNKANEDIFHSDCKFMSSIDEASDVNACFCADV